MLTWQLVLAGREILHFFTISNMCIAPGHGHITSSGNILKLLLFPSFCTSSRKSPFASLFFKTFLNYFMHAYSQRAREDNPYRQFFYGSRNISDLMHSFFMILYMHIALGQGQTNQWGQSFDVNRKASSLWSFVTSFKKKLFNLWFYAHFFMILYMNKAPGQGQTTQWEQNFDVNWKALSLWSFVTSFKKISSTSNFIHIFSWFYTCIYPRARAGSPLGTKFWCQQKSLITLVICCKSLSLILFIFFHVLIQSSCI